jgi:hypothetical protein
MDLSPAAIQACLAQGEGRDIEFKRGLPRPDKTARTLCAFANTRGGMLFVGVDDHGRVLGAGKARLVLAELREVARGVLEPPLKIEVGIARLEEGPVVCCSVPWSADRPHAVHKADGTTEIVVRVGSSNRVATGATLRALRTPRKKGGLSALERSILDWVEKSSGHPSDPSGGRTVSASVRVHGVGVQRARRAFQDLERSGRLVGHGRGAQRIFNRP